MNLFNGDPQHRTFVLTNAALILLGIHFSSYENVHWLLIFIPGLFIFEGFTGISITRHFWSLFYYSRKKRNCPPKDTKLRASGRI